jgi:hypothetical protein
MVERMVGKDRKRGWKTGPLGVIGSGDELQRIARIGKRHRRLFSANE